MRVVANSQLYGAYGRVARDQEFDVDEELGRSLLRGGRVRYPDPPRVTYETKVVGPETPAVASRPFVTCLCVTRNRREWLPRAIESFQGQTYSNRELLILASGEYVRDLVPADDGKIRYVHIGGRPDIGSARNFGCEQAGGEVIAHWDDDDWSAPERLADQVARLVESSMPVTGYRSMRFTDGSNCWLYKGKPDYVLGTSLCYRRGWWMGHPFPAQQVGEDGAFVDMATAERGLSVSEANGLMYATIHAGNTSPRTLSGASWKLICASEAECIHHLAG